MNDLLYGLAGSKEAVDVEQLAQHVQIDVSELARALNHPNVRYRLQRDILAGNKLAITGTPTYIINDNIYTGHIPPEVFSEVIK